MNNLRLACNEFRQTIQDLSAELGMLNSKPAQDILDYLDNDKDLLALPLSVQTMLHYEHCKVLDRIIEHDNIKYIKSKLRFALAEYLSQ